MTFGQLTYLFSILIFGGAGLIALLFVATKNEERVLKKYEWIILTVALLAIPFAMLEFFALKWGAWAYSSDRTFDIHAIIPVETYIFSVVVGGVLAIATLISASRVDRARAIKRRRKKGTSTNRHR